MRLNFVGRISNKTFYEPLERSVEISNWQYVRKPVMENISPNNAWFLRMIRDEILHTHAKEEANVKSK